MGEKRKGQRVGMSAWQGEGNEFQNGNCWYTPRSFSYEWQIQDLQVTSLYEWQVKDLKQLLFQRIASDLYELQTKDLRDWRAGEKGNGVQSVASESRARILIGKRTEG